MYNYRNPSYIGDSRPKAEVPVDTEVKQGLAITPAQMLEMTDANIAISSFGLDYMEGSFDTFARHEDVPIERVHGLDVVDVWEAEKRSRYNILKASEQK